MCSDSCFNPDKYSGAPVKDWLITAEQKLVISFDMCSSSHIIEDLTLTGNINKFLDLFDELKQFLYEQKEELGFKPYKFLGDGWILLFPIEVAGDRVLVFLDLLCRKFQRLYTREVEPILENKPRLTGLTFGADVGQLHRVRMFGIQEYLGRAVILACRLQSAIKDGDAQPQYKLLASPQCYERYFKGAGRYKALETARKLRNVRGGETFTCVSLSFAGSTGAVAAEHTTPATVGTGPLEVVPKLSLEPQFLPVAVSDGLGPDKMPKTKTEEWFHIKIRNQSPFAVNIDTVGFVAAGRRLPAMFSVTTGSSALPRRLEPRESCTVMFWQVQAEEEDFPRIDEVYVETGCGHFVHARSDLLDRLRTKLQSLS